jgi:hypothetical protein
VPDSFVQGSPESSQKKNKNLLTQPKNAVLSSFLPSGGDMAKSKPYKKTSYLFFL